MPHKPHEDIALRRVPGEGPVIIEHACSGLVNDTCRVIRAGRAYSLRMSRNDAPQLGLDRSWECKVLAHAAAAGLAPAIRCCEPSEGVLVADWVSGRTWSGPETREPHNIEVIAGLLRRVHDLPIPTPCRSMSPAAWIAHYSAALANLSSVPARCARLREAAAGRISRLAAIETAPVLCHSDVHRHNVAVCEFSVLLDWEYAHVSDPCWDLAGWVSNNDGTKRFAEALLSSYLGRQARREELERLRLLIWLYDYVCLLWSELYLRLRPGDASQPIAARAVHLERRLAGPVGGRAGELPAH